jgi:lambda family phage portal protein
MAKSSLFTPPNPIDKLVGFFNPSAGIRRLAARTALHHAMAAASPYDADTPGRSRKFYTQGLSPNQITQKSAIALRNQARQLHRNHDISRGILRTMVNNMVGPNGIGIEPQPRRADGSIHEDYAKALRDARREWAKRPEVTGRHTEAKVQRLMAYTWVRDGEAFAQELLGPVPGLTHGSRVPFSLELFEPDFVPYDYSQGTNVHQGIERNAWGKPTAYFVYKTNPLDGTANPANIKRISADVVHHVAMLDRIGQMRGISEFASIITRLEDIKDYEESERIAAKVAAALTAYVKRTSPDGYVGGETDDEGKPVPRNISMAPGTVIDSLAVGEEIGLIDSNRPNPNVVTFRQGQLRAAAAGIGVSYSSAARDYNGTFSAQRQELVEQWVHYATLTDEFVGQFVQPTYATFVRACTLSGAVPVPKDVVPGTEDDALYIAQSMPWIDPAKEASAYVTLVRAGFASEVEVIRKRGGNPRDLLEQVTQWRKEAADRGLTFTSNGENAEAGGAQNQPLTDNTAAADQVAQARAAQDATTALLASVAAIAAREPAATGVTVAMDVTSAAMDTAITKAAAPFFEKFTATAEAVMDREVTNIINLPEQAAPVVNVTVEAATVTVPQAQVVVNNTHPARAIQTVERNPVSDEITRTITTYEGGEA